MNTTCSPFEIVPFEPEHLETCKANGGNGFAGYVPGMGEAVKRLDLKKTVFTGLIEGKIVVVAGIMTLWAGVGEAFASFTPEGLQYMKSIHRKAKEIIQLCLGNGFHRIQAEVDAGFENGLRWVEHLGFVQEGDPMRRYGPHGEDYLRYSIVREG